MAPQVEAARIPDPADESDILREQLDYLIDHAAGNVTCGCSECLRYFKARTVLLEIFITRKPKRVRTPKAAAMPADCHSQDETGA